MVHVFRDLSHVVVFLSDLHWDQLCKETMLRQLFFHLDFVTFGHEQIQPSVYGERMHT